MRDNYAEIETLTRGKLCARCRSDVRPAWGGIRGEFVMKCGCIEQEPVPVDRPHSAKERYGKMLNESIAQRPDVNPLTSAEVKAFISPNATDSEVALFLRYCVDTGLNPVVGEVFLIKYDRGSKASIVVGIAALLKRAARNDHYDGYDSGIVVKSKKTGERENITGSLYDRDSEVLLGGWCRLRRKDWSAPLEVTVALAEYNKGQATWRQMPAGMIEVRAICQAHRRAFPDELEGLYGGGNLQVEVSEGGAAAELPSPNLGDLYPMPDESAGDEAGDEAVEPPMEETDEMTKLLQFCAAHGEAWQDGRFGPQHSLEDGLWCTQQKVINGIVRERMESHRDALNWSDGEVKRWVKEQYDVPLSRLTTREKLDAMLVFIETAVPKKTI